MMIKITEKCSMGCNHCLSDCTPNGMHMNFDTFKDSVDFTLNRTIDSPITISGGEPFENPNFKLFMKYLLHKCSNSFITVTTNGNILSDNLELADELHKLSEENNNCLIYQVVIDDRYYPIHVNEQKLSSRGYITVCHNVERIYPQGRALKNNLEWKSKCSHCFNVRAIPKQIECKTFADLIMLLNANLKFCVPHIDIHGNIKLGESDLCTICSNIYKTDEEIINDILNFHCNKCNHVNDNLSDLYKQFL